jgi:ribosome recycling factor
MRAMSDAEMQKYPDFMEALQKEIDNIRTGRFKPEDALPSLVKGRN